MSISERRIESRFLCADLVKVGWKNTRAEVPEQNAAAEPNAVQEADAVLEDISPYGACVQVEEPIELNSSITLTIGRVSFSGHVSYSVFRDYGYFVGIRFDAETCWSSDTVIPDHLTSLAAIAQGVTRGVTKAVSSSVHQGVDAHI